MSIKPLPPTAHIDFDEEMAERCTTTTATAPIYSAKLAKSIQNSLISESAVIDNMAEIVKFQKLDPSASIPSRQSDGAAGYDVTTPTTIQLKPRTTQKILLHFAMEIPNGMYTRITDRSSLTIKGITVRSGVINSDYCGNIMIC